MNSNAARDGQSQHSNKSSKPPSYDLQAIKRQVGLAPFTQRIHLSSDGFCPCPFHHGDGDKSFHVVQKDDGAFIGTCFSTCGKSFDAIAFIQKFDDVQTGEAIRKLVNLISENGTVPTTVLHKPKPASPMTAEAWEKSGRAVTDADVAKLAANRPNSKTPSAATLNALGFKIGEMYGRTYIVAPYRLVDTFYTLKARNLGTKEFIQENSISQQGLFNIDAVTAGHDVYVVESELDAAVLYESGYIAVSVINAKQKSIEPEVMKKLQTAGRIFLVGDQDEAGQICMDTLARLLPAEKVYRLSFSDAKDVGELAVAVKKTETVLGDFKTQWDELVKDATASWVAHNIPFVAELSSTPQEWIIDRFLPMNGYLLMTGKFGGQKSLSALWMAAGIEAGTSVFGRKVLRKVPVLYVDRENPQATIGERRARLAIPENRVRYWGDWIEGTETPNLDDPRLAEFAVREKGVIIFDSLTDWLEGESENDPSKMTEVSRKFRRLARLGAGVIVLHHDNKNGAGYRGSTAIPAGSDMAVKMAKNEVTGVVEIRTERFRMCAAWEMDIKFSFGEQFTVQVLKDKSAQDSYQKEANTDSATAVSILADHHSEHKGAGMSQNQFLSVLRLHGISKAKGLALLTAGFQKNLWTHETGNRNAMLFHLCGWTPSDAENECGNHDGNQTIFQLSDASEN